jgi:uncharacterized membrane protein
MAKSPQRRDTELGNADPSSAVISATRTEVRQHIGPLPAPDDLARYNEIVPGVAERIVTMAENDHRHQIAMDQASLASDQKHRDAVLQAQMVNAAGIFAATLSASCSAGRSL